MKYFLTVVLALIGSAYSYAQISGTINGFEDGKSIVLPNANVFWEGTEIGTVTDEHGHYTIEVSPDSKTLVASFIGFKAQKKIVISKKGTVNFTLPEDGSDLDEVDVIGRSKATSVDLNRSDFTFKIDDKELRKAACCNLSESFETNASVDVSFTDAVTGTRQIEMLGLAGKYALIQRENIPFARGLNANTGLTYIPGPFVESIQLTKGLSSVMNGYESVTGQINVEFYKPETAPKLLLNLFGNQGGRTEANVITAFDVSKKWSTAFLLHGSNASIVNDVNEDGFTDMPKTNQINLSNRWHYKGDNGWEGQWGISAIKSGKIGGEVDYAKSDKSIDSLWGYESEGNRLELFGKTGYVFKDEVYRSLGLIYGANYQDHNGIFGDRSHFAKQRSAYFNSIFADIIGNTNHKYRTGISVQADWFEEDVKNMVLQSTFYEHKREEIVPGAYVEYTYEPSERATLVAGIRADYNSYFKNAYITPRINLRYAFHENTTLRLGGGRGQRTANIMAENLNVLASARTLDFTNASVYRPEIAWNIGASIDQHIPIGNKVINLTVDGFFTWFENKLVTDLDFNPQRAYFLNVEGSQSLSVLGQIDYEIIKQLEVRLAYKYLDARDAFINGEDASYLIPKHRAFMNWAYETKDQWKFDITVNWFGEKRLPSTELSPQLYKNAAFSESFFTVNTQINKTFKLGLEVFVGVDNLLDFRQDNPIVNVANPDAAYFDTNFAWGPIFGRNIYAGLYYKIGR